MKHLNPIFHVDSYKLSHYAMFPKHSNYMYSHLIPRSIKYLKSSIPTAEKIFSFGLQSTVKQVVASWNTYFFSQPWSKIKEEMFEVLGSYGLTEEDTVRFSNLHRLGFLPLRIRTMPEGEVVSPGIPLLTIENTVSEFYWLTNYLESVILNLVYKPLTVATMMRELALLRNKAWMKTVGSLEGSEWGLHDFSFRGHSTVGSAAMAGMAFTLFSKGSDNIPGVTYAQDFYAAHNSSSSIPATEHSQTSLGIQYFGNLLNKYSEEEFTDLFDFKHSTFAKGLKAVQEVKDSSYYSTLSEERKVLMLGETFNLVRLLLEVYPTGVLAYVSDTYDFWGLVNTILPAIKEVIMTREGTLVIRPDSSDLVKVVLGEPDDSVLIDSSYEDDPHEFLQAVKGWFTTEFEEGIDQKEGSFMSSTSEVFKDVTGSKYLIEAEAEVNQEEGSFSGRDYLSLDEVTVGKITNLKSKKLEDSGLINILASEFGTTTNSVGYKELDSHIRIVLGDGMNYERIKNIWDGLEEQGYAANNVCLAPGAYLLSTSVTRDSLGLAVKAGVVKVGEEFITLYKDPLTDRGKTSPRGFLKVEKQDGEYVLKSDVTWSEAEETELVLMFDHGKFITEYNYEDICAKAQASLI